MGEFSFKLKWRLPSLKIGINVRQERNLLVKDGKISYKGQGY